MSDRDKLMRLANFLVEDILAATDAEIMSEEAEDAAAAAPEPILDIPCMTLKERFPPESFNEAAARMIDMMDIKTAQARVAQLEAENARLREALAEIAKQKMSDDMSGEECAQADWQFGYDACVARARAPS